MSSHSGKYCGRRPGFLPPRLQKGKNGPKKELTVLLKWAYNRAHRLELRLRKGMLHASFENLGILVTQLCSPGEMSRILEFST